MALNDYINWRTACVYGIYGHLGGGKTLTAVEIMHHALTRLGATVVSNVQLRNIPPDCQVRYHFIDDFASLGDSSDDGSGYWSLPQGSPRGSGGSDRSIIVIDEVAEFFDQYSSSSHQLKQFTSWLRHSSKRGQWVFLIVQQPEFIAKSLRKLINSWIMCDDLDNYRIPGVRIRLPFLSGFVRRLVLDRYGNTISRGLNLGSKHYIGQFYDTAQSIALLGRSPSGKTVSAEPAPLPVVSVLVFLLVVYCLLILFLY